MADEVIVDSTCKLTNLATNEEGRTFTFDLSTCDKSPSILSSRGVTHIITSAGAIHDVEFFGEGRLTLKVAAPGLVTGNKIEPLTLIHVRNTNQIISYPATISGKKDLTLTTGTPLPLSHVPAIVRVVSGKVDLTPDVVSRIVFDDITSFGVQNLRVELTGPLAEDVPSSSCRVFVKPGYNNGRPVVNASSTFVEQMNTSIVESIKSLGATALQDPNSFNSEVGKVADKVMPMLSVGPDAEAEARTFVELYVGQKVYDQLTSEGPSIVPHPSLNELYSPPDGAAVSNATVYISSNNSTYQSEIVSARARINDRLGGNRANDDKVNNMLAAVDKYKYENMRLGEIIKDLEQEGNESFARTIVYVSVWLAVGVFNTAVTFFMPADGKVRMYLAWTLMVLYLVGFVIVVIYGLSKRA